MSLIDQRFGLARSKFVFDNEIGLTQIELKLGRAMEALMRGL